MRTHTECPSDSFLAVCFRAANLQQTVIKMEQSMFYWAAIADSHAVAHYHWNTYNVKEHLAVPYSWEVVKPLQEQLLSEDTCGWLLRLSVLLREDSLNFKERVSLHSSSRGHCFLHWNLRGTCSKESRRVFEAWGYSPHFQICFSHFWIWRFLNPFQYFAQRERWYLLELNPCWLGNGPQQSIEGCSMQRTQPTPALEPMRAAGRCKVVSSHSMQQYIQI